jgi:hypothetical protein
MSVLSLPSRRGDRTVERDRKAQSRRPFKDDPHATPVRFFCVQPRNAFAGARGYPPTARGDPGRQPPPEQTGRDPRRLRQDIGHGWGVRSEVARGRFSGLVVEQVVGDDEAGTLDLKLPAPDEPASGGEPEEESEA